MVIFLIAMIGIVLFVLFSLNTPSVNFKKGNLFNTSVFYNNSFWIVFIILSLIAIFNFGTDDASLDANNNVATSKSAATNNQIQQEMDKEKIRANSYKLNIEQVKTEIHKSKFEMVVWVAGLLIASGLIQHFFK